MSPARGARDASTSTVRRCGWAANGGALEIAYHDREWGVPSFDRVHLFELLTLEGAQAGLSWSTILRKREGYRRAFDGFDPARVARFTATRTAKLLQDEGIVRHRGKIDSVVTNARALLELERQEGSFATWLWRFVDGRPVQNRWRSLRDVPARTAVSETISKELLKRGFRFVGPTTLYAFMQAVGMVNDHETTCFRHGEVG